MAKALIDGLKGMFMLGNINLEPLKVALIYCKGDDFGILVSPGTGRFETSSGDVYEGEFLNGLPNGNGSFIYGQFLKQSSTRLDTLEHDQFFPHRIGQ